MNDLALHEPTTILVVGAEFNALPDRFFLKASVDIDDN